MKKLIFFPLLTPLFFAALLFITPLYVQAAGTGSTLGQSNAAQSACNGIQQLDSSQSCAGGGSSIGSILKQVVNILSIVLGAIAIIMIIISGIRFATSGGSATGVTGAKNTLIYAIIGLVIAALAQVLVRWVIGTSSSL